VVTIVSIFFAYHAESNDTSITEIDLVFKSLNINCNYITPVSFLSLPFLSIKNPIILLQFHTDNILFYYNIAKSLWVLFSQKLKSLNTNYNYITPVSFLSLLFLPIENPNILL
jgi:hypothetical protein